jgi:hypothetical protein
MEANKLSCPHCERVFIVFTGAKTFQTEVVEKNETFYILPACSL